MRIKNSGFTLLEILLSVAALSLIAGISIPIYQSFQVRNDLDIAAQTIAEGARRAGLQSQASDGNTSWGIRISSGSMVLFKGASYAARDATYDEVFNIPTSIAPSGIGEIVFARLTGLPSTTGNIVLTTNANETRTITINSKGMANY